MRSWSSSKRQTGRRQGGVGRRWECWNDFCCWRVVDTLAALIPSDLPCWACCDWGIAALSGGADIVFRCS